MIAEHHKTPFLGRHPFLILPILIILYFGMIIFTGFIASGGSL